MGRIVVATDGSSLGNPGPAGWAWVISKDCWEAGGIPRATNQAAELFAILSALRSIPRHIHIHFRTDSQYALKICSVWMAGWKANGWKKKDNGEIANLKIVKEIDRLIGMREKPPTWEWVKGHSGNKLNEVADLRCTDASNAIRTKADVPKGPGWTGIPTRPGQTSLSSLLTETPLVTSRPRSTRAPASTPASRPAARRAPRPLTAEERKTATIKRVAAQEERLRAVKAIPTVRQQQEYVTRERPEESAPALLPDRGLCPACNAPINPLTYECRCSD
jgi:ribonuclease HI